MIKPSKIENMKQKQLSKDRAAYFAAYRKTEKNQNYQKEQYQKRKKMTKKEKIAFALDQLEIIRTHIDLSGKPEIEEMFYNLVMKLNQN